MLLGNWEYDKNNIDILKFYRISANAIYPYIHNGKTFLLRFIPWDEKTENEMEKELEFIQYLQKKGLNVLELVLPKNGGYLLKKDTPWGKYLVCAFKRVDGKQLSEFEYSDEIVFGLGKTLGRLHKYSSEYNNVKKESCFEIIDGMEYFTQNKLKDDKELVLKEIGEIRNVFQKLPRNRSNFGLIHYDFELNNVFYEEASKKYSVGYRHKGIGKKLFELCIKKAKEVGIEKIYISANSSKETQNFYLSVGCIDAEEIDKELFEKEPFDRHMEYKIIGGKYGH